MLKRMKAVIIMLTMICLSAGFAFGQGHKITPQLWLRAVINTVEKGPVDAVWQEGGEGFTDAGDHVIWGYFHASPADVGWGDKQNPDVFVKIWFDRSGRLDVNFFHVSVPDIEVYSDYPCDGNPDEQDTTTMSARYVRHYYQNGRSDADIAHEDGDAPPGYWPRSNPSGYSTHNGLRLGAVFDTLEKGRVDALWHEGGTSTTSDGHQVVWGYFYGDTELLSWSDRNNPDLFVKIWFDASGRVDVNFFHVSVPDIEVCSALPYEGFYDQKGTTIMDNRYVRHSYEMPPPSELRTYGLGDLGKPGDYELTMQSPPRLDSSYLSAAFDWRDENVVTPAKDQGRCGSCWAFASAAAFESKILMEGGPQYDISEQQLISCTFYSCSGGRSDALMFWSDEGAMEEACTEYGDYNTFQGSDTSCHQLDDCGRLSYRTKDYYTVNTNATEAIKNSLYADGPTYFAYDVYGDFDTFWNTYSPGRVYLQSDGSFRGGHAVLIIGWDDSKAAWLCKNSWGGPKSGPNGDGTFWMAYSGHTNNLNFRMANFKIENTGPEPPPDDPEEFVITASSGDNGRISPSGRILVKEGKDKTFSMIPDPGYEIREILVDGKSVEIGVNVEFSNVRKDHTIYVSFEKDGPVPAEDSYTITATAGPNGSIIPSGEIEVRDSWEEWDFVMRPDYGYKIRDVLIDGKSAGSVPVWTFSEIRSDHTIHVIFGKEPSDEIYHTITAMSGPNGSITPSGEVPVKAGEEIWFEIIPDEGYEIQELEVDGVPLDTGYYYFAFYQFENVSANHTIRVTFAAQTCNICDPCDPWNPDSCGYELPVYPFPDWPFADPYEYPGYEPPYYPFSD